MSPPLPYLCLQEIFEFVLHNNSVNDLFSCVLVCKIWSETAIPILWRDPFYNHIKMGNETILIDVYLSSFTLEELKNLKLPTNLIEDYHKKKPKYDYARFLRRMNLTQIRAATLFWFDNKEVVHLKDIQIFRSLCSHFVSHAISIKCVEFEPEYKSSIDFNIFNLPGAEVSLSNLRKISCYGEVHNINLYEQASKISKIIHNFKINLSYGSPLNSSTLIDLSNYIKSQRQLKKFSIDNRIGCYCCPQDLSLALDLTVVFESLDTQSITLSHISFVSIDFYNNFPCNDDAFTNLSNLQIILSSIPVELVGILLIQSGKSLRSLGIEQEANYAETLKYCSENNPNLVDVLIYIDSKEIPHLSKFLRSSTKLRNLELWDVNTPNARRIGEAIDLDEELFGEIGESLPNSLTNLTVNMKWNFSSKSLERFIKNCKAPLEFLGFEFCDCFDNEHFDVLIKNLKRPLRNLNIRNCSARLNSEIRTRNTVNLIQQINLPYLPLMII